MGSPDKIADLTMARPKRPRPPATIPAEVKKAVVDPAVKAKALPELRDKAPKVKTPVEASKMAALEAMAQAKTANVANPFMLKSKRYKL